MKDLDTFIGEHKARTIDLFNLLMSDQIKKIKSQEDELEAANSSIQLGKMQSEQLMTSIQERD